MVCMNDVLFPGEPTETGGGSVSGEVGPIFLRFRIDAGAGAMEMVVCLPGETGLVMPLGPGLVMGLKWELAGDSGCSYARS